MKSPFSRQALPRLLAVFLCGAVFLACAFGLHFMLDPKKYEGGGLDISGEWEFHNGPLAKAEGRSFEDKVRVPHPLPEHLAQSLASEFWYRRELRLPAELRESELALSLGSVKGKHEVYWDGKFLGAGGSGLGIYRIPTNYISAEPIIISVRVAKSRAVFPGIVHLTRVWIGQAEEVEAGLTQYYFDTGVKPLLPASFKIVLFFFFISFFIAVPYKKEYLSFSLFSLCSALATAFYSRFLPGYEDAQFKYGMTFLFSMLSFSFIPMLTADVLRLAPGVRSALRAFGLAISLVFIGAVFLLTYEDRRLDLYRFANAWAPLVAILPMGFVAVLAAQKLGVGLNHRRRQIFVFSGFLFLGAFAWSSFAGVFLRFERFVYPEFLDLFLFAGLAFSVAMDFRFSSLRARRADRVVPKWFSGFLNGSADTINIELPLLVLAVDTVAYTRRLAALPLEGRRRLHDEIRESLAPLMERFGAQKISERGDGGIFAWDLNPEGLKAGLAAAEYIAGFRGEAGGLSFRAGLACGMVRCEMRDGDFSFLGEALNSASRLETLAEPGAVLADRSLLPHIGEQGFVGEWLEADIKGVTYRACPLAKSA